MNVVNGLPAHVLLVHFMVVLAPLTALLEIACALWAAARRGQLVWLTLILAIVVTVLTPITTDAGGWLYDLRRNPDPVSYTHLRGQYSGQVGPVYIEPKQNLGAYDQEIFLALKEFQPSFSIQGDMDADFLAGDQDPDLKTKGQSAMAASLAQGMPHGYEVGYLSLIHI